MLHVGLIIGSTRPNRFADTPAHWLVEGARIRSDLRLTVLDLRDYRLPFFNEPAPPAITGGVYTEPKAETWRRPPRAPDTPIISVAADRRVRIAIEVPVPENRNWLSCRMSDYGDGTKPLSR